MKKYKNGFRSIDIFQENLEKTHRFVGKILMNVDGMEHFVSITNANKREKNQKIIKDLKFDKKMKADLYEAGYVLLFSNFDHFMYTFALDVFSRFPNAYLKDKSVDLKELKSFSSIGEIREYFKDRVAIEKSYSPKDWIRFLDSFDIKVFNNKIEQERFFLSCAMRNAFMHSGSRTNTQFKKEVEEILKTKVPLNQKIDFNRDRLFHSLYADLTAMAGRIKKQVRIT